MFQPYRIKDRTIADTLGREQAPSRDGKASAVRIPYFTDINGSPLVSLTGDTPLIPLTELTRALAPGVALRVKLDGLNPGGSIKDRPALSIVRKALRDGDLTRRKTLLDATSGNTGIAYAMLGAALGFPVQLAIPADASPERLRILRAYGVELTLTDRLMGPKAHAGWSRNWRREGLFVGVSASAAVVAGLQVGRPGRRGLPTARWRFQVHERPVLDGVRNPPTGHEALRKRN